MTPSTYAAQLKSWEDTHWRDWVPPPQPSLSRLYHYTDAAGLIGILKTDRLWATDARYLNDKSELTYACDLIEEFLNEKQRLYQSAAMQAFIDRVRQTYNSYGRDANIYVSCFCASDELLSQWRVYAGIGLGYAVGFNASALHRLFYQGNQSLRLRPVVYDKDRQVELIRQMMERVFELFDSTTRNVSISEAAVPIAEFSEHLRRVLHEFLFCFKHPAFREESEWRTIYLCRTMDRSNLDQLEFRSKGGILTPYIPLNFQPQVGATDSKLPIESITLGPALDLKETQAALGPLLAKYGYGKVEQHQFAAPLR